MDKQTVVKTYVSAWNETDEGVLKQVLAGCVAQAVSYCDPFTDPTEGAEALAKVMSGVSQSFPGVVHEIVGEPDIHHNFGCYRWLARMAGGKEIAGTDYVEFGTENKITKVVSFTNPADWQ